jgi:hypothetical protein
MTKLLQNAPLYKIEFETIRMMGQAAHPGHDQTASSEFDHKI